MKSLYLKVYVQTVMDLELFIEMLGIPSTSGEERRFADFLKERLAAPEIIEKEVGVPIELHLDEEGRAGGVGAVHVDDAVFARRSLGHQFGLPSPGRHHQWLAEVRPHHHRCPPGYGKDRLRAFDGSKYCDRPTVACCDVLARNVERAACQPLDCQRL